MGPTASGKTDLAIKLVQKYPCDIISVDSSMVYRDMDIGTAKPTKEEQKVTPHRLIDILDPAESYSAAQFRRDALCEIEDILTHERMPLLVGGTMLYFKALQEGLSPLPSADPEVRAELQAELDEHGLGVLFKRLQQVDPESGQRIKANDAQRILRALEVYLLTGKPLSQIWKDNKPEALPYKIINCALIPEDRALLHQQIAKRFDLMLKRGFLAEVEKLYKRGDLNTDLPSMRSVGYRQAWQHLAGEITFNEMREKTIAATRQLAKRQMTWLKSWPNINVIKTLADVEKIIGK